jgi:hypothetical protein
MNTKENIRPGDTVLIRCKAVPTTEGSTRELYPGVRIVEGASIVPVGILDVVSVEHAFRIGDSIAFDGAEEFGQIVALWPSGPDPISAWVKTTDSKLVTAELKYMQRVMK